MKSASILHRITLAIAGLALLAALVGYGTPEVAPVGRTIPAAPGGPLTITSPAFANGAPIPVQYTCKGADIAPPLTWSAPLGAALVVDDPDAPGGLYVHWIVTGIAPGPGQHRRRSDSRLGEPACRTRPARPGTTGPCPPAGTGTHHYRFTLYQLPNTTSSPADGPDAQAAQTIARAATAQAQLVGTFGG